MFTVCVRDHMMIAHSFSGEVFGPAQRLHGATYIVDVEFRATELDADGVVLDINLAGASVREVLASMNYRNLDAEEQFFGRNTTTEFIAKTVFDRLAAKIRDGSLGSSGRRIVSLRVTLHESHLAWAAFESQIAPR